MLIFSLVLEVCNLESFGEIGSVSSWKHSGGWKSLGVIFIIGLIIVVVSHVFSSWVGDVRRENLEETARQFKVGRLGFSSLENMYDQNIDRSSSRELKSSEHEPTGENEKVDGDAVDDHNRKAADGFKETMRVLANSQGLSSGYGLLSSLYMANGMIYDGRYLEARDLLNTAFHLEDLFPLSAKSHAKVVAEKMSISRDLALLLYARSCIAEASSLSNEADKASLLTKSVNAAKALSELGSFANLEGLLLLSRLGDDVFSKEDLRHQVNLVNESYPELRTKIKEVPALMVE